MSIHDQLGTEAFWGALRRDPRNLARAVCEIDLVDLQETLRRQPALRAWVSAAYETARIEEARAERTLNKTRARVMIEADKHDPQTGKKKTVPVLDAEVDAHPDVDEAHERYLDTCQVRAALRAMNEGMEDRLAMLQQISANQRREFGDT